MRSTQIPVGVPQQTAPVVQISALYAAARRTARSRTVDGWLAVATATVLGAFAAAFFWYLLNPAASTLAGH